MLITFYTHWPLLQGYILIRLAKLVTPEISTGRCSITNTGTIFPKLVLTFLPSFLPPIYLTPTGQTELQHPCCLPEHPPPTLNSSCSSPTPNAPALANDKSAKTVPKLQWSLALNLLWHSIMCSPDSANYCWVFCWPSSTSVSQQSWARLNHACSRLWMKILLDYDLTGLFISGGL